MNAIGRLASGKVLFESRTDAKIAVITINRPERRNAVDNETADALTVAFRRFDADAQLHAAVLTGAGGAFCAGADLKALGAGEMYKPWGGHPDGPCHDQLSKPLIAAVEGHACAGGLGLALRCDLRVAADGATFSVLSRRWGVPMSDGTPVRLPRLIGRGRALDMLLTARPVEAEEALRIGLADRLAPRGKALEVALALARQVAAFPQAAVRSDRAALYDGLDLPLDEALIRETEHSIAARDQDAVRGAARFADGAGRHGAAAEDEGA